MDYYLRTTDKESFLQDLRRAGIDIEMEGNYFQNESIIIDWIGQIPNPVEIDEEGNQVGEVTFKDGQHVNIRSKEPIDIELFQHTQSVYPEVPYRMFS